MAAFTEIDWRRLDVWAIVGFAGLAAVDERRREACRAWLGRNGYTIDAIDFEPGLAVAIPAIGELFRWEEQFGYRLEPGSRNLDALRDGFDFEIPDGGGHVLELNRPDAAWRGDRRWLLGLLAIAQEHSRYQLALGRRFFTVLVVPEQSPLLHATIEPSKVPALYWDPCREIHEFVW